MSEEEFNPLKAFMKVFQKDDGQKPAKHSAATQKFISWLESLDHSQRIKKVLELGKESLIVDNPEYSQYASKILAELEAGGFYERQLALISCISTKNSPMILRFSNDESAYLRRYARRLAIRFCNQEEIVSLLCGLNLKERRELLKKLRRARNIDLIDKFLHSLKEQGDSDLKSLLFFGSTETVKEFLPEFSERLTADDLSRFAYLHSALCIEFLLQESSTASVNCPRLAALINAALKWLPEFQADRTLVMLEKLLDLYPSTALNLKKLLHLRTEQTLKILLDKDAATLPALAALIARLPEELLLKLVSCHASTAGAATYEFKKLSCHTRLKVYEICCQGWRNSDGAVAAHLIELLPQPARRLEAQAHLKLPNLESKLPQRLQYARLTDFEFFQSYVKESLASPDIETRAEALFHYVYAHKFSRSRLPELLELLHKRKNEADPVREKFLAALAQLPPSAFGREHLSALACVFDDALKAQDLSFGSLASIGALLLRLFPFHKEFAREKICAFIKERGPYMITYNSCRLLADDVKYLCEKLLPVIEFWEKKEKQEEICQLAAWLGLRLENADILVDALCRIARQAKNTYLSERALGLVYSFNRRRFEKILAELLSADESWGLKNLVYDYLSKKKQSLLTPYLGQKLLSGRFGSGKNCIVPNFTEGFQRWTGKQLHEYGQQLIKLATQESSDYSDRIYAVYRLCRLPEPDFATLKKLSSLENKKDEALRDFTIRQMADTDNACAVPLLIACLDDERGFQAIYALRGAMLSMQKDTALKLLKSVKREKLSIAKEVLRLAGDLRTPEAFAWLIELAEEDLHRDLRVALLRALWNFPEEDRTWALLRKALSSGDSAFVDTAIRFPAESLSNRARQNLILVYKDALDSEDAPSRLKTLAQISSGTVLDPSGNLFESIINCLNSRSENLCLEASRAAYGLYAGRKNEFLVSFLSKLVLGPLRNLLPYLRVIISCFSSENRKFADDAQQLFAVLSKYERLDTLSVQLAVECIPGPQLFNILENLDQEGRMHYGVIESACRSFQSSVYRVELIELERRLHAHGSENLRRLGLALLSRLAHDSAGWTHERLNWLFDYRKDNAIMVASAAEFTLPPAELALVDNLADSGQNPI